jgi:energy-coupling factor transporter ATP-binding protein EcfA2
VKIGQKAVVIAGHSGRGKSTLAAALARAGHPLLADDITVIRFDAAGTAFAVPGSPHVRLNPDSIAANALDVAQLGPGRLGDDKKIWYRDPHEFDPVPVAALIRLDLAAPGEGPGITRVNGPGAVLPLQDLVYRFALARRLGAAGELAHGALRLAAAVPIHRLTRAQEFAALDATLDLVLRATAPD